ncbi:MAG: amino acid permease [Trebonia sp.]
MMVAAATGPTTGEGMRADAAHRLAPEPPEGFWYPLKCRLLGPPLVTGQLAGERLSRPLALGVLSCDGLSSAAYGTEEILYALLPFFGLAAFTLVLPLTLLVLFGVLLVVLSYREVVSVYTRAGGSYVVARENFGPRVAQVAAVALLIDYVVTVAVQTAAGSAAIVSAFPALSHLPVIGPKILLVTSVAAIGLMCLGNLRGLREAGRVFALPTYLFAGSLLVMIVTGLVRELVGGGLPHVVPGAGTVGIGTHSGLIAIGAVYIMAKAFANGGSSLTGIEAVSNAVSALRPPEGRHARQLLTTQGALVAVLIAGISWLAHVTHAIPYTAGFPTVLAQEASVVFGHTLAGQVMFFALQAATAAILFTGGNTSFTGFPFLASFVAEDSFLPRWLGRRGHRLVFSNGILLLAVLSVALMLAAGATVDALIPFYAIGVFTGFAMAGFGMARYHRRTREPGWRRKLAVNMAGGIYTALVVLLFAVVKFTEGAWLIVIIFPVLVFILIRLNREYQAEAACLADTSLGAPRAQPPNYSRRVVLLLVDSYDPATIAALKYARSLRPTVLRAVHFSLDSARADQLCRQWVDAGTGIPLELADCPDRRLAHAAARLATSLAAAPGTHVTVVLPRRCYPPLAGRLLHDHTADRIARVVSRVPDAAATIVPFDVTHRVGAAQAKRSTLAAALRPGRLEDYEWPAPPAETDPIGSLYQPSRATVEGRVRTAEIRSGQSSGTSVLACTVSDSTGELTAVFLGRAHIAGMEPGRRIRLHGKVGIGTGGRPTMTNPAYELLA